MPSELTTAETVEWEGLLARNSRGKIEPGSPESRRLLALTTAADGKGRALLDAVEPERPMTRDEATQFYGIAKRCWYELSAIARKYNDPVPWHAPADMPAWFARMKSAGARKHPPPGLIQQRADEARLGRAPARPVPAAPVPDEPPPADPQPPIVLGAPATNDEILLRYQRIAAALGLQYEQAAAAGRIDDARTYRAEMDTVTDRIRQWSLNAAKLREAERWVRPEDFAETVRGVGRRIWKLLRAELERHLPPDTVAAAFERITADLPSMIPADLRLGVLEKSP